MGESKFPNCPLLERVELFRCSLYSTPPWAETFAHVTTLSIGMSAVSAHHAFAVSPRLRELTIYAENTGCLDYSPIRVDLQYLQILRVHGGVFADRIANFRAPVLEELHFKAGLDGRTAIDLPWAWDHFELHCLHLYALLPEIVRVTEPKWATYLSWLVLICTGLETLYISKWMEEDCKKFMDDSLHIVLNVL